MSKWSELFPHGRRLYYEGNDPESFCREIKKKFGVDPSENNQDWIEESGYSWHCPARLLDAIYGSSEYDLGS